MARAPKIETEEPKIKSYCFTYHVVTKHAHDCNFFVVKDFPRDITPETAFRQFEQLMLEKYAPDEAKSVTITSMSPMS